MPSLSQLQCISSTVVHFVWWVVDARWRQLGANLGLIDEAWTVSAVAEVSSRFTKVFAQNILAACKDFTKILDCTKILLKIFGLRKDFTKHKRIHSTQVWDKSRSCKEQNLHLIFYFANCFKYFVFFFQDWCKLIFLSFVIRCFSCLLVFHICPLLKPRLSCLIFQLVSIPFLHLVVSKPRCLGDDDDSANAEDKWWWWVG